jgi:hypothetical protein
LGIEDLVITGHLIPLALKPPVTGSRTFDLPILLAVGFAYLIFLLAKSLPSFIQYFVKTYLEISRTIK